MGLAAEWANHKWSAANWRTLFLQANLRQTGHINKWTIPNARVVASQCWLWFYSSIRFLKSMRLCNILTT